MHAAARAERDSRPAVRRAYQCRGRERLLPSAGVHRHGGRGRRGGVPAHRRAHRRERHRADLVGAFPAARPPARCAGGGVWTSTLATRRPDHSACNPSIAASLCNVCRRASASEDQACALGQPVGLLSTADLGFFCCKLSAAGSAAAFRQAGAGAASVEAARQARRGRAQAYGAQAVVVSIDPRRVWVADPADTPRPTTATADFGPHGEAYCWWQVRCQG